MAVDTSELPALIRRFRDGITWKPSAAARHLLKRRLRGHLPADAMLADYEVAI